MGFMLSAASLQLVISAGAMLVRGCAAQAPPKVPTDFKPNVDWNIILHSPMVYQNAEPLVPAEAKVWDIDLGHALDYPQIIPLLKRNNKLVICYFNGGAVQAWDNDKEAFPEEAVGKSLAFPFDDEEWYLDIRNADVVAAMKARLAVAVDAGCDAVDPDNVDAWAWGDADDEDPTGFRLTTDDYAAYLNTLADHAHTLTTKAGNNLLVGQKNAPDLVPAVVQSLDFAVLESCRRDDFCDEFQPYIAGGKPVFQIEYPPSVEETGELSDADNQFFCLREDDSDDDFSKVLKWSTAQVDGWGQYCGGSAWETPTFEG
jgi:hypothetical protein